MRRQCCAGERTRFRLARRLSAVAASMVPGAVLLLLPKCPLCLAAWLAALTGLAFPAAGAACVRGSIVIIWIATATLAVAPTVRRRCAEARLRRAVSGQDSLPPGGCPEENGTSSQERRYAL